MPALFIILTNSWTADPFLPVCPLCTSIAAYRGLEVPSQGSPRSSTCKGWGDWRAHFESYKCACCQPQWDCATIRVGISSCSWKFELGWRRSVQIHIRINEREISKGQACTERDLVMKHESFGSRFWFRDVLYQSSKLRLLISAKRKRFKLQRGLA